MVLIADTKIVKPNFESIPDQLKAIPQWLLWKAQPKKDKPNEFGKVPYHPKNYQVDPTDPKKCSTFEEVKKAYETGKFDGIGFTFTKEIGFAGIDIDNIDLDNLKKEANHIVQTLNSYTEITPSGKGLRVIAKGNIPECYMNKNVKLDLENYYDKRFFTITGQVFRNQTQIEEREEHLEFIISNYFDKKKKPIPTTRTGSDPSPVDDIDDNELMNIMFNSKNGQSIKRLFDGDISEYNDDHSSADQALCNHLAFFTAKDAQRMDSFFRQSGLYRDKWDRKTGASTYGEITIQEAIGKTINIYSLLKSDKTFNGDNAQMNNTGQPQEEWEMPVSFDEYNLPTFPTNIFPDWLADYVEGVAESTQTPVDMPSMAALSVLSIGAAKKFEVNAYGDWMEPLNIYVATLMGPANRKSAVNDSMVKPVLEYEKAERDRLKIEVRNNRTEKDALLRRLEAVKNLNAKKPDLKHEEEMRKINEKIENHPELYLPSYFVDDVTAEKLADILHENNGKVGILSAEGGIFEIIKGRYSKELNMDIFLKGHAGDMVKVDRKNAGTTVIDRPAITMGIFAQPDVIKDLPSAFSGRGLTARFLYSLPKDFRGHRKIRPKKIPSEIKEEYMSNMKKLLELQSEETATLFFSNEADFFLQSFQQEIEERLRDGNDLSDIAEWAGKLVGEIVRIAGLLHIAKHLMSGKQLPQEIEGDTLIKAVSTKEYFISHAKATFGCMEMNKELEDIKYLLSVVERKAKERYEEEHSENIIITYREVQQLVKRRFKNSESLKIAMSELGEYGYVKEKAQGRKILYHINPYIFENYTKSVPITPSSVQTVDTKGNLAGASEIPLIPNSEKVSPVKEQEKTKWGHNGDSWDNWDKAYPQNKPSHTKSSRPIGDSGDTFQQNENINVSSEFESGDTKNQARTSKEERESEIL